MLARVREVARGIGERVRKLLDEAEGGGRPPDTSPTPPGEAPPA
jgi:hypothetical protein